MSTLYRRKWPLLVFLLPALAFLIIFLYYPFVQNIINSVSQISGLGTPSQGFQEPWYANYAALLTDPRLGTAMKNTLILMVCTVVFEVGIALVLALLVDSIRVGAHLFRTLYFFPIVISATALGLMFNLIFLYNGGMVNQLLTGLGLTTENIDWKDQSHFPFTMFMPVMWQYVGFYFVILVTGLNNISPELYEAASLDGCAGLNRARYIFIAPFFIVYAIFTLYPQLLTIYNSFFENYRSGLNQVGPNFVGLQNYITLFTPDSDGTISILKYAGNTIILWLGGAIPQIAVALLLAVFFTSYRLKIRGQRFFKTVIYMPNLIMASAFSMLFYTLFSPVGPINQIMLQFGWSDVAIDFFSYQVTVRGMICLMNFLLWFGNTAILLMAGIMGIDQSLFEAANIDGANSLQVFFKVTLPLLMPILIYTVITAMIGGLQMFDVPQVLTNGMGTPNRSSTTLVMFLNNYLKTSKNYGMAGAISVIIFLITGALSLVVYRSLTKKEN